MKNVDIVISYYKDHLFDYLRNKGYNLTSSGYNTVCFKIEDN